MNARIKFIVGGVLIMGTAAYLMASSISETGLTWMTTTELATRTASDSSFGKRQVKVGAQVVPGSIVRGSNGRDIRFVATDGSHNLNVTYANIPPDTFTDSALVILTGSLRPDGSFHATELLAKCASRFEVSPDSVDPRYRKRPDYKTELKGAT